MGRILRVGLMVLLAAAAGVGIAWGQGNTITVDGVEWQYAKIAGTNTCSIQIPESNRSSISGSVTIPKEVGSPSLTVVEIAENAFKNCSNLKKIIIQNTVQTIGKSAFYGCRGLTEVTIPSSVQTIGEQAFSGCSGLTEVSIPEGVKTIGFSAFLGCSGLTEITIPGSVKTIETFVFSDCIGLKEFKVDKESASFCADDGVLFTKKKDKLVRCPSKKEGKYKIPNVVTIVEDGAFEGCEGLTAVTIPSSVKKLGGYAFFKCFGLKEVIIPGSVETIGISAFQSCSGLESVVIPGSLEAINRYAFANCSKLSKVYWLAKANRGVGKDAFKEIASSATLYVRQGERAAIMGNRQTWWEKFDKIEEGYVVTFQDGEGKELGEQLVESNGTATVPTAPTKEGYTFAGWQLDGKKYDFSTPVTKDIKLVAVWKQNYTVTFDAQGGTPIPDVQMVVQGGTVTEPTPPTKDGYTFVEWQLDGVKYEFSTPVTKDIKLVAVWKKKEESTPSTPEDPEDPKTAVESVQLAGVRAVRNPVGEALELEGMERAARVEVYSVAGARVHAEVLRGTPRVVIDAQSWANGVYVVKVEASDGERTLRVVK